MKRVLNRILAGCAKALLSGFLFLLAAEGATRIYVERYRNRSITYDRRLGWKSRGDHRYRGRQRDAAGREYDVHIQTDANGFRQFGDRSAQKPRVFVIGDSFTHAVEVSNEHTYYHVLAERLDAEIFAYGALGYGTLQEFMILDEWLERIRPDLIVIQFCANDFINNSFALERASVVNNNRMRRPYLESDGTIRYAMPARWSGLRHFANRHSRLLYFLISRLDLRRAARRSSQGVEHRIMKEGVDHDGFRRAADATERIFAMIAERAGPATVLAFHESRAEPYDREFRRILARTGIAELPGIPEALRRAEAEGRVVRAWDGSHWNPDGHRVVGELLAGQLEPYLVDAR